MIKNFLVFVTIFLMAPSVSWGMTIPTEEPLTLMLSWEPGSNPNELDLIWNAFSGVFPTTTPVANGKIVTWFHVGQDAPFSLSVDTMSGSFVFSMQDREVGHPSGFSETVNFDFTLNRHPVGWKDSTFSFNPSNIFTTDPSGFDQFPAGSGIDPTFLLSISTKLTPFREVSVREALVFLPSLQLATREHW